MKRFSALFVFLLSGALIIATSVSALVTNGDFEAGTFNSWTKDRFINGGISAGTGNVSNSIDLSAIVPTGGAAPLSQTDPHSPLKFPAYGNYSARVNSDASYTGGSRGQNGNKISQTITSAYIDPSDNLNHTKFAYAAVMVNPVSNPHSDNEKPYFRVRAVNLSNGNDVLYEFTSYVNEPGKNWQNGNVFSTSGGNTEYWKYLNWQVVDLTSSAAHPVAAGDDILIEVIAAGCSLGGHPGYVYVDEITDNEIAGPTIKATGPATVSSGGNILYSYEYKNFSAGAIDATVTAAQPAGVTFTTVSDTTNCSLNGSGVVTCNFANVPAGSRNTFTAAGTVTAANGSQIEHGNYDIAASGFPTVAGQTVITSVIGPTTTSTGVTSSVNPSAYGEGVTFTATVSPNSGTTTPTGSVQFVVNGSNSGPPVALNSGSAQIVLSNLPVGGPYMISANYLGGGGFAASSGTLTPGQNVVRANTTTTVNTAPNPSKFGESVTLTATVTASSPSSAIPAGSVQFSIDGTNMGSPVVLVGGVAHLTTSAMAVGGRSVTASYSQTANFNASTGAASHTVEPSETSASVSSTTSTTTYGQSVTFTATVVSVAPGSGTPAGTMTFYFGGSPVPGCISVPLTAGGQAVCTVDSLPAGSGNVTATYNGGGNHNGGSGTVFHTIEKADLTVSASSHTVTYGDAPPAVTASYSGFVLGQASNSLNTEPTCSTSYMSGSGVSGSPYSTSCAGGVSGNYNFIYSSGSVTVNRASLVVTGSSHNVTYGEAAPMVNPSYSGFVLSEGPGTLTTAPICSTTYTAGSSVAGSPYPTSCSGGAAANYNITYTSGSVTVNRATITITPSSHGVTYGDAVPVITPAYAGFVLGQGPGDLTAPPTCTTSYTQGTGAGTPGLTTNCSGAASGNYDFSYVAGLVTVAKKQLSVTASSHTVSYGDPVPPVTPSYSGFVSLQGSGDLTLAPTCSTTYVVGAPVNGAPYPTRCSAGISSNYSFVYTNGTVSVNKANVVITASSHNVTYGDTAPAITPSYAGFLFGQGQAVLSVLPTCSTGYGPGAAAGSSPTTSCSGASSANYVFTYVDGSIAISKASLAVFAPSPTLTYGDSVPVLTPGISGFVLAQNASVLSTQPACSTTYLQGAPVAIYSTSCSGGASPNYNFTYTGGNITVGKKELTVTADNKTRIYGASNPALTASISGFVLGQILATSGVAGSPALSTTAVATSGVSGGPYPIVVAVGTLNSSNYSFRFVNGSLTIDKALLTINAVNASRMFGMPNPQFSFQYSGFVNGENSFTGGVTGTPQLTTTAVLSSPVGEYPITSSQGTLSASNYYFAFNGATLTVIKAPTTTVIINSTELSGNNTRVGQSYSVRWRTDPFGPVSGTLTGTVIVSDDNGATCSAPVESGVCELTSSLPGLRSLTAAYSGDGNFHTSVSGAVFHPTVIIIAGNIKRLIPFGDPENLQGVTVTIGGSITGQTVSNASGNYSFASMVSAGEYNVLPSGFGYTYSPAERVYTNVTDNITDADFTTSNGPVVVPSPTPTGNPTPTPDVTPSPTPIVTPTPVVTPTPGITPTPVASPTPTPDPTPTPTPGPQIGGEGDVVDAAGVPMGGDGVHSDDLASVRGFALGNTEPDMGTGQFQRGDTAPRVPQTGTFGDAAIDASDVTVVRLYSLGMLPGTSAAGPVGPEVGPTPSVMPDNQRVIRAVSVGTRAGEMVTVHFEIDSQGDESSASFTVKYDESVLSNPAVSVGGGVSTGTNLGTNVNFTDEGKVGILLDSVINYTPGTRQIISIRFNVSSTARTGLYPVTFENGPTVKSVSSNSGVLLPTIYQTGFVQIGSTSAGVSVSGRVMNASGQGIRNVVVTMTAENGARFTATTGSFGAYRFEGVEAGRTYVVSAIGKRFRFSPRVVNLVDSVTDLDMIGQQ